MKFLEEVSLNYTLTKLVNKLRSTFRSKTDKISLETDVTGILPASQVQMNDMTTGINLLRSTRDFTIGKTKVPGSTTQRFIDGFWNPGEFEFSKDNDGFTIASKSVSGASSSASNAIDAAIDKPSVNSAEYTMSFDVMIDDIDAFDSLTICRIQVLNKSDNSGLFTKDITIDKFKVKSGEWFHLVENFKTTALSVDPNNVYMMIRLQLLKNGSIHFRKPMLQYGTIYNPIWAASPFDVPDMSDEFDSLDARIESVEDTLDEINDYTTGINLLRGTRDFSLATKSISDIANTINGIDGFKGKNGSNNGIGTISKDDNNYAVLTIETHNIETEDTWYAASLVNYDSSKYYTFMFDFMVEDLSNVNNKRLINYVFVNANNTNNQSHFINMPDDIAAGEWITVVYHINEKIDVPYLSIRPFVSKDNIATIHFRKFALYEGHINHPIWSPSPFDTECINDITTDTNLLRGTRDFVMSELSTTAESSIAKYYKDDDGFTIAKLAKTVYTKYIDAKAGDILTVLISVKCIHTDEPKQILYLAGRDNQTLARETINIFDDGSYEITSSITLYQFRRIQNGDFIDYIVSLKLNNPVVDRFNIAMTNADNEFKKPCIYRGYINNPVYSQSPMDVVDRNELTSVDAPMELGVYSLNSPQQFAPTGLMKLTDEPFLHHGQWEVQSAYATTSYFSDLPTGYSGGAFYLTTDEWEGTSGKSIQTLYQVRDYKMWWRVVNTASNVSTWRQVAAISDITAANLQGVVPVEKGGNGNTYGACPMNSLANGEDLFKLYEKAPIGTSFYYAYSSSTVTSIVNKPISSNSPIAVICNVYDNHQQAQLLCQVFTDNGTTRVFNTTIGASSGANQWVELAHVSDLTALTAQIATLQTALLSSGAITQKQLLAAEKEVQATLSSTTMELPSGEIQVDLGNDQIETLPLDFDETDEIE